MSTKRDDQAELDELEAARKEAPDGSLDELPVADNVWPAPVDPAAVADKLLEKTAYNGDPTFKRYQDNTYRWVGYRWVPMEDAMVDKWLWDELRHANFEYVDGRTGLKGHKRWLPNRNKIGDVRAAMYATIALDGENEQPLWLGNPGFNVPVGSLVAMANGLLEVPSRNLYPITPRLFNLVGLPFNYVHDAPVPVEWLKFLHEVFLGDQEAIQALQEWFGYVLSGRTDQQKILLLLGDTRSGKGTIARILEALCGKGAYAGNPLVAFAERFGLANLIGKSLCVVADARLSSRVETSLITSSLLHISGEDEVSVDRKFKNQWTGKLPTRLMVLSNVIPRLDDPSGAIAGRYLVIKTMNNFYGREDKGLESRLRQELQGILSWSLDGLDRLNERGHFVTPDSSLDSVEVLQDVTSPIKVFLSECCDETDPNVETEVGDLFEAWKLWADKTRQPSGSRETFGRNVLAARPNIRIIRPQNPGGSRVRKYAGIKPLPAWTTRTQPGLNLDRTWTTPTQPGPHNVGHPN